MRRRHGLMLIAVVSIAGCDGDAIDPQTGGEGSNTTGFSIVVTDDPANDPSPVARSASAPTAITGEIVGAIRVSLRNDDDDLVDIGIADLELPLQHGADSVRLSDLSRPPTDSYVGIQLRFEGVDVTVEAGSEVGDSTITSDVVMGVGSGSLATIEIATETFDVSSDTQLRITVDLNSELWITGDNLDDNVVPQADLASSVSVELD